ncbi:MAG: DUF4476 domain-containing protein [Flavobacteriales bacterium]
MMIKNNMKFLIAVFTLVFHFTTANAQCKLSIKAADTLAFILTLNDARVTNQPIVEITLNDLQAGKQVVTLSVPRNAGIAISQELNLKPHGAYYYEVARVKGKYKLQLISESIASIPESNNEVMAIDSALSMHKDTLNVTVLSNETITNNTCAHVATTAEFELHMSELKRKPLDVLKLESMNHFVSANCINVDQLRYMMAQLSTEDHKLKLLQAASTHITNWQRLPSVEDDFYLARSKKKVREIVSSK